MQIREQLGQIVDQALRASIDDGSLSFTGESLPSADLERPRDLSHGDWATSIALRSAKLAHTNPRDIAQTIVNHLPKDANIQNVEIAGPGFINFRLAPAMFQQVINQVREQGSDFGKSEQPEGTRKVDIEYISANPTGPMHVGHGRWAALGDATSRVMAHAGYHMYQEFYVNNHGTQLDVFANSVSVRYQQLLGKDVSMPEKCYGGAYVKDIAQKIIDEDGDKWLSVSDEKRIANFKERAYRFELNEQHRVCAEFGVHFDTWFSERSLYKKDASGTSAVDRALKAMRDKGYVFEKDGAVWFKSTAFGDDKDRVLIKENGEYTYFISDVAYHYNKIERGFDHLIDIWGADHHGYIARCQAMMQAWGYPDMLEVMLGQLVNLYRNGKAVRMSKRTGEMVTFEELIDEVGVDATRWMMLSRSADQTIDFDIEAAKRKDASNPVYYVQYNHARICSILRHAAGIDDNTDAQVQQKGYAFSKDTQATSQTSDAHTSKLPLDIDAIAAHAIGHDVDLSVLTQPSEIALMRKMDDFTQFVADAARDRAAFRLTHYALELARLFSEFYTKCHVIGDDPKLQAARLALCDAVRIVLALTLSLLGISAPEHM